MGRYCCMFKRYKVTVTKVDRSIGKNLVQSFQLHNGRHQAIPLSIPTLSSDYQ